MGGTGRDGDVLHAPVHADHLGRLRVRLGRSPDDKRHVPVAERILVDADGTRGRRKLTRPYDAQTDTAGDGQVPVAEGEPLSCVVHGRRRAVALAELGKSRSLANRELLLAVLQRLGAAHAEVPDRLLLRDGRALAEPVVLRSPAGEQLVEPGWTALAPILPCSPGLGDALVPHPPAAAPLGQQCALGRGRDANPVGKPDVPHDPDHVIRLRHSTVVMTGTAGTCFRASREFGLTT